MSEFILAFERLEDKYVQNTRSIEKYYDEIVRTIYYPKGLTKKDEEVRDEIDLSLQDILDKCGQESVKELQEALGGGPSSPGNPPGRRTGKLQAGIRYEVNGDTLSLISDAPYSGYLEYGTRKMDPRPFFFDALVNMEERVNRLLGKAE